jgi:hypothetical protein
LHYEILDAATELMPETGNSKAVSICALAQRRCGAARPEPLAPEPARRADPLAAGRHAGVIERFHPFGRRLGRRCGQRPIKPAASLTKQAVGRVKDAGLLAIRDATSSESVRPNSIASRRFGPSRSKRSIQPTCRELNHSAAASPVNRLYQIAPVGPCHRRSRDGPGRGTWGAVPEKRRPSGERIAKLNFLLRAAEGIPN